MSDLVQFLQGGRLRTQEITESGNFIVPPGVYVIFVSGTGAGAGASAGSSHTGSSVAYGGIGGSSGASVLMLPMFVTPGQVIPIVLGVGGLGGTGTTSDTLGNIISPGNDGTDTTIGDLVLPGGGRGYNTIIDNAGRPPFDFDDEGTSAGHFYHGARSQYPSIMPAGLAGVDGAYNKLAGRSGGGSLFAKGGDAGDGAVDTASPGQDGSPGSRGSGGGGGGAATAGYMTGNGAPGGDGYVVMAWQ